MYFELSENATFHTTPLDFFSVLFEYLRLKGVSRFLQPLLSHPFLIIHFLVFLVMLTLSVCLKGVCLAADCSSELFQAFLFVSET